MAIENKELTPEKKNDYKELLLNLSSSIKEKETLTSDEIKIDENLDSLSLKLDSLSTQEQANELLDDVKKELQALKEYWEYKDLSEQLEWKIEDFEKKTKNITKQKLWELQKNIYETNPNLTKEQIITKANKWRQKSSEEISWIVWSLSKKKGWIWKLARKATKW